MLLQVVKQLQVSTTVRAFSRASPLEEFTIESSREFSTALEEYRKSAVLNLAAAQFTISPDSTYNMRRELIDCLRQEQESSESDPNQTLKDGQVQGGNDGNRSNSNRF